MIDATRKWPEEGGKENFPKSNRALLVVRGDVGDAPVDLRARATSGDGWDVTITVGLLGRGRAPLGLVPEPGDDGHRPAHLLARTHRARGQVRLLVEPFCVSQ